MGTEHLTHQRRSRIVLAHPVFRFANSCHRIGRAVETRAAAADTSDAAPPSTPPMLPLPARQHTDGLTRALGAKRRVRV
jgi:hypothetical protein